MNNLRKYRYKAISGNYLSVLGRGDDFAPRVSLGGHGKNFPLILQESILKIVFLAEIVKNHYKIDVLKYGAAKTRITGLVG